VTVKKKPAKKRAQWVLGASHLPFEDTVELMLNTKPIKLRKPKKRSQKTMKKAD
jgi:hypothetical protein